MNDTDDPFYIGWAGTQPREIAQRVTAAVCGFLGLALAIAAIAAIAQQTVERSVFEFGTTKTFRGVFSKSPTPQLRVARPGATESVSSYALVAPKMYGLSRELADAWDGKGVELQGTLIYRGDQTMIEVLPETLKPAPATAPKVERESLGTQTLRGEIVDSKCYFGVMNPGRGVLHRACARRCLSGGIPAVLMIRDAAGNADYYILQDREGGSVNESVLDLVAEPVEVTGDVFREAGRYILAVERVARISR